MTLVERSRAALSKTPGPSSPSTAVAREVQIDQSQGKVDARMRQRAARLADQLENALHQMEADEKQAARTAEASKMRRTAHTIASEWQAYTAAHPTTEADAERLMREKADRRYRRAQSEAAAKQARLVEMAEKMGTEKRWRIPKDVKAEAFKEPRVSCFPAAELQGEQSIVELETMEVGKVLWVRCDKGWIGTQFAVNGFVRVQLVPETEECEAPPREFMLEALDHITDSVDKATDACPLDRMLTMSDVRDARVLAQRRREELRQIPSGHHDLIRQTFVDMQRGENTRAALRAIATADAERGDGDGSDADG
jgi:hypothetical protein